MADAEAQPPEVRRAELRGDVAQAVVAGDAAAELHLRLAGQEIELVVDDEDFVGRDREEARAAADRPARQVHVGHRASAAAGRRPPSRPGLELAPRCGTPRRASPQARRRTRSPRCAAWRRARGPDCPSPTTRRIEPSISAPSARMHRDGHQVDARAPASEKGPPGCARRALSRKRRQCALTSSCRPCLSFLACRLPSCRRPSLRPAFASAAGARLALPRRAAAGTSASARLRLPTASSTLRLRHDGRRDHRIELAARHHDDARRELQRRHVHRMADVERRAGRPSMNSGRSFGRHEMSSSVITWLTIAPDTFTAGEISPLTKCSGTFMWILRFSSTRWKSTCRISFLNGCICTSRSSTFVDVAVELHASGSTRGTPRCAARGRARCGRARSAAARRRRRRRCRAPCRRGACGGSRRGLRSCAEMR